MNRFGVVYTTIVSGGSLSPAVAIGNIQAAGLIIPTITSAFLYLHGGFSTNSADAKRVMTSDFLGSANPAQLALAAGAKAVDITQQARGFPFIRIETSAAQTDTRTFAITYKD